MAIQKQTMDQQQMQFNHIQTTQMNLVNMPAKPFKGFVEYENAKMSKNQKKKLHYSKVAKQSLAAEADH
jgi:hypothetical protein